MATKLKTLRKKHQLRQIDLADKLGVSKSIIGLLEAKKMKPYPKILKKLSDYFDIAPEDIRF